MNLKNKFFLFLFSCTLLQAANMPLLQAQVRVRAYASDRRIVIGDQVKLWLEVQPSAPGDQVAWPKMPDTLNGLEIVEQGKIDTLKDKQPFVLKQRLLVTGFDSGSYYFPSITFTVNSNGQVMQYHTDSVPIQVQTVAVDTTKAFKPIKEIVEVKFSIWDYWLVILAVLLLAGFGIFIWIYFYKNRGVKAPKPAKTPPEKAHEKALRLLAELRGRQLETQGRSKEYFSELSDIVRTYIEERFGITAMEQTTDELLALMKKQQEAKDELRKLRPQLKLILRTADLAKFAKANPLPQEYNACMDAAIEVVKRTQLRPEEGDA